MTLIQKLETAGRMVLWLSLASAVVLVPVVYIRQRGAESQQAEAARQQEEERVRTAKEDAEKSVRLTFASMGPAITALSESTATGRVWFSNVSPRSGVVCIAGTASNAARNMTTESLTTCKQISPYESNAEMALRFAGGDLSALCKGVTCAFSVKDVADYAASPVAAVQ